MTPAQKKRLDELAERMKTAKGAALDAIVAEVDKVIGFDAGDDKYNPEADAAWEIQNRIARGR